MNEKIDALLDQGRRLLTLPPAEFRSHIDGTSAALKRSADDPLIFAEHRDAARDLADRLDEALKNDIGASFPGSTAC